VYCHAVAGTNASSDLGPDLTHVASRRTLGAGILENTPGNLAGWVIDAQAIKPGNHMPPMDLSGEEVQALLAYLQTLE
jgi:cytochrome c oxidase subunit 2